MIITIGRQYGSGGRELGEKLAARLGYKFYDEELVKMAAEKSNMHHAVLQQADETATKSLLYALVTGMETRSFTAPMLYEMPINDKLFIAQTEIIKELAEQEDCIIVGRCADYVLQNTKAECLNLFTYAPMEARIARIMRIYNLSAEKAREKIQKTEKRRRAYYNYYTSNEWGRLENYHLCIDTGTLGIDNAVDLVCDWLTKKK